jgi:hypothetical protein
MSQPQSRDEYLKRFAANQKVSGHGLETTVHAPCAFCAAPDFMVHRIIDIEAAMRQGATCKECGRSAKALFSTLPDGGKQFEIVQIGGDDPPAWLDPPPRRTGRVFPRAGGRS